MNHTKYVCLSCRVCYKNTFKCPHCSRKMIDVGQDFKAPRRTASKQWRLIEDTLLVNKGAFYRRSLPAYEKAPKDRTGLRVYRQIEGDRTDAQIIERNKAQERQAVSEAAVSRYDLAQNESNKQRVYEEFVMEDAIPVDILKDKEGRIALIIGDLYVTQTVVIRITEEAAIRLRGLLIDRL